MLEISSDLAGQRIDNFLMSRLKGVPRSMIYRIVRKGEVRVNKGRIKPDYRLKAGDVVRVPPVRVSETNKTLPGKSLQQTIEDAILYEDKSLLVINKPSGVAVHGGSGISHGVIEALRAKRPDAHYLELVHRLDRDTSGCLLIAKKRSALRNLHEQLRHHQIDKIYQALLKGNWGNKQQVIDAPLRKNVMKSGERMVKVSTDGKPARSIFKPLQCRENASLVQIRLETGRTHQIRVHAAYSGHPIAGDEKYGDDEFNQQMKKQGLRRLFLHAFSLTFTLPDSGKSMKVEAPLDEPLLSVLKILELH
jgi:23S rRNA pseudouridine955/2504/2580 synthase